MYFASFWRNNSVFVQSNHEFKKYQLQKKYILPILGEKQRTYARGKKKENAHFKTTKAQEIKNFTGFRRNGRVLMQKIVHLK